MLFIHLLYFYSAYFSHHFFQVSPAVCHPSSKMGCFSFWCLGGWLSLSSCIRLTLIQTLEGKDCQTYKGPCEIRYVFGLTVRNHYFCEEYKEKKGGHVCTWWTEMGCRYFVPKHALWLLLVCSCPTVFGLVARRMYGTTGSHQRPEDKEKEQMKFPSLLASPDP